MECVKSMIFLIGSIYLFKFIIGMLFSVCRGIKIHILPIFYSTVCLKKKYGQWAVITGPTSGIGLGYSKELAKQEMNLVLIARDKTKLDKLCEDLVQTYSVEVRKVVLDFNLTPNEIKDRISPVIQDIQVGILVNNAGVITPVPMLFSEMEENAIWEHIYVNMASISVVTHTVLPKLIERQKGAIVNLSSLVSVGPTPLMTLYGATKAFIKYFSKSLEEEVRDKGITVQTLTPGYVNTQMVAYSFLLVNSPIFVPNSEVYAKCAVRTLGLTNETAGYWLHDLQAWLSAYFPSYHWTLITAQINKYFNFHNERSRVLETQEKKKIS